MGTVIGPHGIPIVTGIQTIGGSAMSEVGAPAGWRDTGLAKAQAVGPVNTPRVVLATAGLVGLVAASFALVASFGRGTTESCIAVVLGLAVTPIVASPIEWFVHRFVYHEPVLSFLGAIFKVHTAHHYAYFPTWRYVTGGPARRLSIRRRTPQAHTSPVRNAGVRLAHYSWYLMLGAVVICLPAWLTTHNVAFLIGITISLTIVSNLFIVVHDTIHRPGSHRIVEAQPWYAFLDRHHYIHHVDLGTNLNFLLPLADLLFGSLRRTLTPDELSRHGSLAAAKAQPRGEGEPARTAIA